MNELIKITETNGRQAVSARELHAFLESSQQFADWIKGRIDKYGFVENQDFEVFHNFMKNPNGGRPLTEYALTIDCAKELAMVEGNDKGKQARQYFIQCEKIAKANVIDFNNPATVLQLAQNWAREQEARIAAEEKAKQLQAANATLKVKADFVDKIIDTDEKIDIGQAAKILELPFGRNTLFQKLREKGVFFRQKNEPKQVYVERGYFQLKEKWIDRNNHDSFMVIKVLVTQKGLEFISRLFSPDTGSKQMARLA